ncbi:MAG: GNAT family N-acetyltransferase [Verrucomicrobia bacterium]|nr:GNAT family N-acetyltransferase [Verrucomicrobiota bacterium]
MKESNPYEISTDRRRFDVDQIHRFLSSCYWAANIPRCVVEQSIKHSLCFGAFCGGQQIGFARAITDYATFAYIADVFVVTEHRGRGVAKQLIRATLDHPDLQGLRRFLLATEDAHGLYARFGFKPLSHPEHYLSLHFPDVYRSADAGADQ